MAVDQLSKSDAIRKYLTTNPDARSVDVIEALARKGVKVSPQLVSSIRSKEVRYALRDPIDNTDALAQLQFTKRYVESVGGIGAARQLIDVLEGLFGLTPQS